MPSFDYTVELERALLKSMTGSPMMCRMFVHKLHDEMFTSGYRKFILAVALDVFSKTKTPLTRTVFEYEVGAKVTDKEQALYIGEWNLIEALETDEHPDVLIDKLNEANVGRQILASGLDTAALLEQGRIAEAVALMKQTAVNLQLRREDRPIVELCDFERRKQLILDKRAHPEKYLGIKTGFGTFDARTGGLFGGELTLLAGLTGSGKSTMVKMLERNIVVLNSGKNVLHIANEEYQEQVENKFDANFTGIPYLDFKLAKISDEDMARWEYMMKNWKYGRVFSKEVPAFTDITLAEQAYFELQNKGIPIHVIIIDHLPHVKPIQQAWGENDEMKKAASDCKELARSLHIPVIVPTQAATIVADKQERGKRAGKLDVFGSKGQVHVANTFIIFTEQGKDESDQTLEDWQKDTFLLSDVKKNRDGPPFSFRLKHQVKTGIMEEVSMGGSKEDTVKEAEQKKTDASLQGAVEEVFSDADKAHASLTEGIVEAPVVEEAIVESDIQDTQTTDQAVDEQVEVEETETLTPEIPVYAPLIKSKTLDRLKNFFRKT